MVGCPTTMCNRRSTTATQTAASLGTAHEIQFFHHTSNDSSPPLVQGPCVHAMTAE